jgi:hypothetical protein
MSDRADELATRVALHRVAVHVLARRRQEVTGRIGLRATPGGFGTPSFGPPDAPEVLRVAGGTLLREVGGDVASTSLHGSTLRQLAAFAGTDLSAPLDVGRDTPAPGDPDEPLAVDDGHALALAEWFHVGWQVLDRVAATATAPTATQLWPEHFDAGSAVSVGSGPDDRCNLGASAGDGGIPEPYLYVGPWGPGRPGDPAYWNAPFGAVLRRSEVVGDPVAAGEAFLREGLARLAAGG